MMLKRPAFVSGDGFASCHEWNAKYGNLTNVIFGRVHLDVWTLKYLQAEDFYQA